VDRVAVSVPHRATWGWGVGTDSPLSGGFLHMRRPGLSIQNVLSRLSIPIESTGDLLAAAARLHERVGAAPQQVGMPRLGEPYFHAAPGAPAADRSTSHGPRPQIHLSSRARAPVAGWVRRTTGSCRARAALCAYARVRTYLDRRPLHFVRRGSRHPSLLDGVSRHQGPCAKAGPDGCRRVPGDWRHA